MIEEQSLLQKTGLLAFPRNHFSPAEVKRSKSIRYGEIFIRIFFDARIVFETSGIIRMPLSRYISTRYTAKSAYKMKITWTVSPLRYSFVDKIDAQLT